MSKQVVVNKWTQTPIMDRESIIRFQILVYCHLAGIKMTELRLNCLTLIGMEGKVELSSFLIRLAGNMFASPQSARNAIDGMQKDGLLIKGGVYRKEISLHPDMKIQTCGTILVKIDCLHKDYES